jgi:hypothetical protein
MIRLTIGEPSTRRIFEIFPGQAACSSVTMVLAIFVFSPYHSISRSEA